MNPPDNAVQAQETVRAVFEEGFRVLVAAGIECAVVDAELLIGHVLGLNRGQIQAAIATGQTVESAEGDTIRTLFYRRASREPVQHIMGVAPFRYLELQVGVGVFVPRPETEFLAGLAIDFLKTYEEKCPLGVDLGTGSGAIALAMATEFPSSRIVAVEKSAEAYLWAERNFAAINSSNAHLLRADLAETSTLAELNGTVSVVVSNPPYIPDSALPRDPEVRLFDPAVALYGGADGLDVIRSVSHTAARLLKPGGTLLIEHGETQAAHIQQLLHRDGWSGIETHRDLTDRDRVTVAIA